ncbi:MAG: ATP-binding cassette domain-containing protein [Clostridium sp.]
MLKCNNIYVNYGEKEILKNISFSLSKNETISLIGPSGCGKSTLLLAIAKLKEISKGSIENSFEDSGLILQQNGLFPWKTIRENIKLGLKRKNISKEERESLTLEIAEKIKITHILDKYPMEVSGGERQRAAVSRVVISNPKLLLLDEPSSALDSINKENFQSLLKEIQEEYKISFIIVTHNIEEAVFLGQRIAVMNKGEIINMVDNPFYGMENIRKNYEFFDKCNEIRELLEGGEEHEKR